MLQKNTMKTYHKRTPKSVNNQARKKTPQTTEWKESAAVT